MASIHPVVIKKYYLTLLKQLQFPFLGLFCGIVTDFKHRLYFALFRVIVCQQAKSSLSIMQLLNHLHGILDEHKIILYLLFQILY